MLTIKNITKLLALAMIVVALNVNADALETPEKARLSARHAQLTNLQYKLRQMHSQLSQQYNQAVQAYQVAKWAGRPDIANQAAQNANMAAKYMQMATREIARTQEMIQRVESQLVAISRTPTGGNVVYDIDGQPIDQSWWMGPRPDENHGNTNKPNRPNGSTRGLLGIEP